MQLDFATPPTSLLDPVPDLKPSSAENALYYSIKEVLLGYRSELEHMPPINDKDLDNRRAALIRKADAHLQVLEQRKAEAWDAEVVRVVLAELSTDKGPLVIRKASSKTANMQPWLLAGMLMASVLHSLAAVSRTDLQFVLSALQAMLYGAFVYCNVGARSSSPLTAEQALLLDQLPSDVRTVLSRLGLEPPIIRHATCPKCHRTYAPNPKRPKHPYPKICTNKRIGEDVCGEQLLQSDNENPVKSFPYHSLSAWIANLFGKSELLLMARDAWTRPLTSLWTDIWDAPSFREFLGPDGRTPFSSQPDNAVHLVFSLFIDWFNPFGNKKAGKMHSIRAIYLVCLNLPPHLRYRPENVYLAGIIPGPSEPRADELNHYLRPLVDELLTLWHRGLCLSLDRVSWFLRAAVVPLVCDLPALRKVAGFASHSSAKHFCSFCQLPKSEIGNLDRSTWPRYTRAQHYEYARRWRDATSEAERAHIYNEHGIRWSELLRLPYWDPMRYSLVDAMHNLLLGDLRHHCRRVWGINVKDKKSGGAKNAKPHGPEVQQKWLEAVASHIKMGLRDKLVGVRKDYLLAVAEMNEVVSASESSQLTKEKCADALLKWWSMTVDKVIKLPPVLPEPTTDFHIVKGPYDLARNQILNQETISQLRLDIVRTVLPSWLERPPRNFGSASHGKLKADHWRTVCTVSMVITLVRLWGSETASPKERILLENFVHLVSAVELATKRSLNQERIDNFDDHMHQYLAGLQELFSDWHHLVPNHHLSLHLRDLLELFGPVHAWWAYPFERFNGLLQGLNTNSKTDSMPMTFMKYFYIGANVRWLMASTRWPDAPPFHAMVAAFENTFRNAARGTRVADFHPNGFGWQKTSTSDFQYDAKQAKTLSRDVYDALLERIRQLPGQSVAASLFAGLSDRRPRLSTEVQYIDSVDCEGVPFARKGSHGRNSFVLFTIPDDNMSDNTFPRAGRIREIFLHVRLVNEKRVVEPFFVVQEYENLSPQHVSKDPYRLFPDLQTMLFYNRF
ncbi:hypothetical protein NUW54_g823 [Trametes sanguinea]|uniref:Uncharacterized protein n=1 Tax=Trametes sanguinea TaxID=158606 RepID=A0ACC1Q9Y3_9APHY|nr:hypothetical protein NUW54_g823 [Trametes sanguinea]